MSLASPKIIEPHPTGAEEYLPDSDGKPMAETDLHRRLMQELLHALEMYYQNDPQVYVSGNIFLYYLDEDKQRQQVSPDIMVIHGIEKKPRRVYKLDAEGKAPDVVIELTSASTKLEDLVTKRVIYATLGVREYFLFDPYVEYLQPPLRGYLLDGTEYRPMMGNRMFSEVMDLELKMEDNWLRLYNRRTGERLLTPAEAEAKAEHERKARMAAESETKHERKARMAAESETEQERKARLAAETEIANLKAQLAKLRKG